MIKLSATALSSGDGTSINVQVHSNQPEWCIGGSDLVFACWTYPDDDDPWAYVMTVASALEDCANMLQERLHCRRQKIAGQLPGQMGLFA